MTDIARLARRAIGVLVLAVACWYLARVVSGEDVVSAVRALLRDPLGVAVALVLYGGAFALRSWAWTRVLDGLGFWQSWAAIHVSLLGNHVLPFRLGEALRVTSVLRRTPLGAGAVVAATVGARSADLLAVLALALLAAPELVDGLAGWWVWPVAAVMAAVMAAAFLWRSRRTPTPPPGPRPPGHGTRRETAGRSAARMALTLACALIAWILESAVVYEVAGLAGVPVSPAEAVAVTAVTIAAQAVAVTPGGIGSYEAAATAALTALGVAPGPAFAVALLTHALKTAYALAVGGVALFTPSPGYFGRFRLPRRLPDRPPAPDVPDDAPVVVFIPVYNEEATIGEVVRRLPAAVAGRRVVTLVIDDGSTDASADRARAAGATVLPQPRNLGLGAAVRRGLREAATLGPAAAIYLDADLEYFPEDLEAVAAPVLSGEADYVIGSRFAGTIERMLPHRRLGNRVLTAWVRWLTRRRDVTDGQSGYRAFSPAAVRAAEVIHDYNYAQVLTLDLLAKGFVYREVPIRYSFRQTGESFVKLGRYLRKVVPAVHRELNT
ncbi:lysylphosphatidylglycerol synthase domain-containing protein [Thermoactinospora rubra]|uniref:lysylphosphatidylglycerol synthase domain-containing protein n=1 Tax=Thermoactinospora rubra TaxID=1088767 RepID=UPI000A1202B1|nr:lysylphosphatidylglycerol synthase domain-containing protein [Thermoactinospora rubra]